MFKLHRPQADGSKLIDHLKVVAKVTRSVPAEMRVPELPQSLSNLWAMFLQIHGRRTSNGFGANPITWEEINAWQAIHKVQLTSWEADCLASLDDIALKYSVPEK